MLIYLAGPLFCQAEQAFNQQLTERLEERGFAVYLPQRDGIESGKPPYDEMSNHERQQAIFALDRDKVLEADVLLIVLDGRVPDEGACVEGHIVRQEDEVRPGVDELVDHRIDPFGRSLSSPRNVAA